MPPESVGLERCVCLFLIVKISVGNWIIFPWIPRLVGKYDERCGDTVLDQARRALREGHCGFVLDVPMLCCDKDRVDVSPQCDLDMCPDPPRSGSCGRRSLEFETRLAGHQDNIE